MGTTAITRLQQDLLFKVIAKLKADNALAGCSLNESSLALQFDVSRTPIRAVLKYMADQGITKAVPNKGFVLLIDAENIAEMGKTPISNPVKRNFIFEYLWICFW